MCQLFSDAPEDLPPNHHFFSMIVLCSTDDITVMCDIIVLCAIKRPYVDLSTRSNVPSMKAGSPGRHV